MNKNDLERRLEAAEKQNLGLLDEIKNLKAKLAEMQDEPEIPDKPDFEMDENFYYLDSLTNDVEDSYIDNDSDAIDFNMFHTEEYAQEFARKCKLIAMMLHCKWYLDRSFVADYENGRQVKWFVYHDHHYGEYMVKQNHNLQEQPNVYFSTEENAQKCADWMNTHAKRGDSNDEN